MGRKCLRKSFQMGRLLWRGKFTCSKLLCFYMNTRILISSCLWSIGQQMRRWRHHKKILLFYYIKKMEGLYSKRSQKASKCGKSIRDTRPAVSPVLFPVFFYHILSSSAIYYWTDAQRHWIHLLMWSDLNCHYLVSFLENINDLPCTIWQEPDLWGFQNHDLAVIYLCTAYTTHVSTQWHIRIHCVFVNPTLHFVCLQTKIYLLIYV